MVGRDCDVLIVGAGLPGMALALALARDTDLSVALADRAALPAGGRVPVTGWDVRIYAVSPGSVAFLERVGAWARVPPSRVTPIERMKVSGDSPDGRLGFSAREVGVAALAWVAEESSIRLALGEGVRELAGAGRIELLAPAAPRALEHGDDRVHVRFEDGSETGCRLLVGADGARSWVREAGKLPASGRSYGQQGVVANFTTERPHGGCALQWFLPGGEVLAWLPLPGNAVSMVWSAADERARELLALPAAALAEEVAARGGGALGRMAQVGGAAAFPLRLREVRPPIDRRIALVGDAAHLVHPLAGQGVNLGFGDARCLADILAARGPVRDAGEALLLRRYAAQRAEPVAAMQALTDGLWRLFREDAAPLRFARNAGMSMLDRLGPLKRVIAQPALA